MNQTLPTADLNTAGTTDVIPSVAIDRIIAQRNEGTDDAFLKELMRLGRMQKHLFVQGKRTGDKEYAEVLVAITELTNTLRKQLMEG